MAEVKMLVGSGISNLLAELIAGLKDGSTSESRQHVTERVTAFYADHLMDHTGLYPCINRPFPG